MTTSEPGDGEVVPLHPGAAAADGAEDADAYRWPVPPPPPLHDGGWARPVVDVALMGMTDFMLAAVGVLKGRNAGSCRIVDHDPGDKDLAVREMRVDPVLYATPSGRLAHVVEVDGRDELVVSESAAADVDLLRSVLMNELMTVEKTVQRNGAATVVPAQTIPRDWLASLLAKHRHLLPMVKRVVSAPLVGPDGVRWERGYDAGAAVWVSGGAADAGMGRVWDGLVRRAGREGADGGARAAREAAGRLLALFEPFAFKHPEGAADVLGCALTPWLIGLLGEDDPVPMVTVGAKQPMSGKTTVARMMLSVGGLTLEGRRYADADMGNEGDASGASVRAMLDAMGAVAEVEGRGLLFDNISHKIGHPALERVLTSRRFSSRLTYGRRHEERRWDALIVGTMNRARLSEDMVRRTFPVMMVRMAAESETERAAVGRMQAAEKECALRARDWSLATDVAAMVSHWMALGRPPGVGAGVRALAGGSYAEWARVVGGVLEAAGVEGWGVRRDETMAEEVMVESDGAGVRLGALALLLVDGAHGHEGVARELAEARVRCGVVSEKVGRDTRVCFTLAGLIELMRDPEIEVMASLDARLRIALDEMKGGFGVRRGGLTINGLSEDLKYLMTDVAGVYRDEGLVESLDGARMRVVHTGRASRVGGKLKRWWWLDVQWDVRVTEADRRRYGDGDGDG